MYKNPTCVNVNRIHIWDNNFIVYRSFILSTVPLNTRQSRQTCFIRRANVLRRSITLKSRDAMPTYRMFPDLFSLDSFSIKLQKRVPLRVASTMINQLEFRFCFCHGMQSRHESESIFSGKPLDNRRYCLECFLSTIITTWIIPRLFLTVLAPTLASAQIAYLSISRRTQIYVRDVNSSHRRWKLLIHRRFLRNEITNEFVLLSLSLFGIELCSELLQVRQN